MKRLLIFTMALLMVFVCVSCNKAPAADPQPEGLQSGKEEKIPLSASVSSQMEQITPEDRLMRDYVSVYEKYLQGFNFSPDSGGIGMVLADYAFGYLNYVGDAGNCAVYKEGDTISHYTVSAKEALDICEMFFDPALFRDGLADLNYPVDFESAAPVELELLEYETLENGIIELLVGRTLEGRELLPVKYTFQEYRVEGDPAAIFKGRLTKGEVIYRFVSVQDQPMQQTDEGETIVITRPSQLAELAKIVNSGDWKYQNIRYELGADIDMEGIEFTPIGTYIRTDRRDPAHTGFNGVFDGMGYTISNLSFEHGMGSVGFFAVVGRYGEVKNLTVTNSLFVSEEELSLENSQYSAAGGIAGQVLGGTLDNCVFEGDVSGIGQVGGIAGSISEGSTVQNCRFAGTVTGNHAVGGLIGATAQSNVVGCTAQGEVNAITVAGASTPKEIGGFIGSNNNTYVERGIASVAVLTQASSCEWIGSFMGYNYGDIISCFYNQDIAGEWKEIDAPYMGAEYTVNLTGLSQPEFDELGSDSLQ